MLMDRTTLEDLEVLRARDGGMAVLDVLDHTRTRHGRQALRLRLERPLSSIQEIRDVQAALPVLAESRALDMLGDTTLAAADRYIHCNVVLGSRRRLGAVLQESWLRLRYPGILRELVEGRAALEALVRLVRRAVPELTGEEKPSLLRSYGDRLEALGAHLEQGLQAKPFLLSDRLVRSEIREEVLEIIGLLGELDALRSMALASMVPGWTTPELVESPEFLLEADAAVHPFLPEATPNPVRMNGSEPLVFLTGPNMGGKTTYLRTVAILVLLAQTGMNVPAASLRLAPVDVVFTSLNPADNLRAGISFFYAEILRVKEAARLLAEGRRGLILFDEVFKGTNVMDAQEASAQVIEGFARTRRSGSIFASHLSELYDSLRDIPAIRFWQFGGELRGGKPTFSYELGPGVSHKRFGVLLLEQARVPELMARISG